MTADALDSRFRFDVIGVGALNMDYIAAATPTDHDLSLTSRISDILGPSEAPIEWGAEQWVEAEAIYAALEAVDSASLTITLGGSAFNAITALAQIGLDLRLGYVGVAGRTPIPGRLSSVRQLEKLGIDSTCIRRHHDALSGICFSFLENGDRTLLTHGGANEAMADYVDSDFDALVAYISSARVVHLTSFLDARTPARIRALVDAVRKVSPDTLISFDPGHVWATEPTPDILALVGVADYLLLNNREFGALGGQSDGGNDSLAAARILNGARPRATVVVKKPSGITAFTMKNGEPVRRFYPQATLPDHAVEDATGAGDVFAAGLLAVITADRLQLELGALLGMALARHKLRYVGSSGHIRFPEVARDFVRSLDAGRRGPTQPLGVFIAHGGNSDWLAVRELVETELQLPVHFFERQSWGSLAVTEALEVNLARCSFAICVLTIEDLGAEGMRPARQNVVHEIGLFQGRYGFDRVLVLVEDGCDYVPPLAAPYAITFPHNSIASTFWRVRRMLKQ